MEIIRVKLINSMGKTNGCETAPVEVLNALKKIGSKENGELVEFDKLNFEEIHVDLSNLEEAEWLIEKNSEKAFCKHDKAFFVGGDHSISYSILKSFNKVEDNPLLVVFDAHADCMEPGEEPTHEEWLRGIVEKGFDPSKIILISTRNIWKEEADFLKEKGILWIKMDVLREDIENVCDLVMERARKSSGFYISIDIDAVDPGFAPGVAYPEAGGLSSGELIYFVKRLNLLDNFRGADIVEINPYKDVNGMTVKLGARVLAEMI